MSDTIESQGKTVEDAIAEALLRLGARRDEVEIKVLEEPRAGLFGLIGGKPARVRVTRRAAGRGAGRRDDRRDDRREDRRGRGREGGREGGRREDRRDRDEARGRDGRAERSGRPAREERPARPARDELKVRPLAPAAPAAEGSEAGDDDAQRRRRRRGGRGRRRRDDEGPADERAAAPRAVAEPAAVGGSGPAVAAPPEPAMPSPVAEVRDEEGVAARGAVTMSAAEVVDFAAIELATPRRGVPPEETPALIGQIATELMVKSGFPCRCEVRPGEYHQVRITTDEMSAGVLIGRHGGTIDALEHLVERIATQATGAQVHLNLDINNYRRRREEKLLQRAQQAIERVLSTGEEMRFEPLCGRERRLVHLEAAKSPGLQTYTVLGEFGKQVVVAPAGAPRPPEASGGADADHHDEAAPGEQSEAQTSADGGAVPGRDAD